MSALDLGIAARQKLLRIAAEHAQERWWNLDGAKAKST
jgi:hypothetical protein